MMVPVLTVKFFRQVLQWYWGVFRVDFLLLMASLSQ